MIRIIIIAGETSGDVYGAKLMQSIYKKYNQKVEFWGIGGPAMMRSGLNQIENIDNISVVGFSEAIKKLPYITKLLKRVALFISELSPADIILIDFPGFNLNLAKKLKKINPAQHITYFISPQIWAWNEGRIKKIKQYINKMMVIFPFEEPYYKKRGVNAVYVGHPFLDSWKEQDKIKLKTKFGFDPQQQLVGIFPGSRNEEIEKHLPIYLAASKKIKKNYPKIKLVIGLAPSINKESIKTNYQINDAEIVDTNPLELLECVDAAIVTSGTISLQAAFMLTPCVVGYKLSKISWLISRLLVKINYISMANIIADKMIYKEFIQAELNIENITREIEHMLVDDAYVEQMKVDLNNIKKEFLIKENAIDNASNMIYENINENA